MPNERRIYTLRFSDMFEEYETRKCSLPCVRGALLPKLVESQSLTEQLIGKINRKRRGGDVCSRFVGAVLFVATWCRQTSQLDRFNSAVTRPTSVVKIQYLITLAAIIPPQLSFWGLSDCIITLTCCNRQQCSAEDVTKECIV